MKCSHQDCGKKFNLPLELFNGSLACPHCKRELSVVTEFKLTARNQELYNLSEIYFLRYLSPKSYQPTGDSMLQFKPEKMLHLAIENCQLSAKEGNPNAVFRLGYYNEHYLETARGENDRIRMAFGYYASLCYYERSRVVAEENTNPMSEDEFAYLKRQAAVALLKLYVNHAKALKGAEVYDYEKNKARITSLYGNLDVGIKEDKKSSAGKVKNVYSVLASCFNKTRAPLCGLFYLSGAELKGLFAYKKDPKDKKPELFKFITKGLEIRYIYCNSEGAITDKEGVLLREQEDRLMVRFSSENKSRAILDDIKDEDFVYLYFFNTHGKHQYLNGGQIKKVGSAFEANNHAQVCRLIDFSAQEYLFFDDDIFVYKKGGNIERCVDALVDKICGGEE